VAAAVEQLADPDSLTRRLTGLPALAAVVYLVATDHPAPGLAGQGLVVLCLTVGVSLVYLLWLWINRDATRLTIATIGAMSLLGAVLGGITASGVVFAFAGVYSAGRPLGRRPWSRS
jgi:multisubunit Na+/H+ antiporter MnhB subunit